MTPGSGAEAAFKHLFAQEYSKLCRYALTFLSDSHQAEDVVQETFIRIWERQRDIIASPNARFYLISAVRNNCITALRKLKTQNIVFTDAAPEPEPEIHFTALQRKEAEQERSHRIAAALDLLPPKCREVFLLIKMQGMTYQQAADTLGISVKTVENQMGKALKVLRENVWMLFLLLSVLMMPGELKKLFHALWQYLSLN
jgi:RNA polymerase sigma-70 factor (ECF subfamily)